MNSLERATSAIQFAVLAASMEGERMLLGSFRRPLKTAADWVP